MPCCRQNKMEHHYCTQNCISFANTYDWFESVDSTSVEPTKYLMEFCAPETFRWAYTTKMIHIIASLLSFAANFSLLQLGILLLLSLGKVVQVFRHRHRTLECQIDVLSDWCLSRWRVYNIMVIVLCRRIVVVGADTCMYYDKQLVLDESIQCCVPHDGTSRADLRETLSETAHELLLLLSHQSRKWRLPVVEEITM